MFDTTSRYASLEIATLTVARSDDDPRTIRYVRRRFLPQPPGPTSRLEHTATQGERIDTITARYLGDPTQYWRVCDVNLVTRPADLTEVPGARVVIPVPGG